MKYRYKGIVFLFIVWSIGSVHCYSQPQLVKEPKFASPNAAALGKYADIPISYHTGVPEISVPIYTIQEGTLSLPVSLSYHSSGIRVDEVSSSVGLGWSLNAGGMITRTVKGGPDEGIVYGTLTGGNSPYQGWGWYKDYGILPVINTCAPTPLLTTNNSTTPWTGGCQVLYVEASKGYVDTEPDLFSFNFAGYSGKFFFDANRKVHMIPESDVFIEPINSPAYFHAWRVIAPDGSKYYFGGAGATEISYSDPGELNTNLHVSSSTTWYLYRIESKNSESWINIEYADDTYSFGTRGGHSVTFREVDFVEGTTSHSPGEVLGGGTAHTAPSYANTTIVDGKRVYRITTSSGYTTIDFIPSTSARQDLSQYYKIGSTRIYNHTVVNTLSKSLQSIQVTTPTLCKKFDMSYDYFSSAACSGCLYGGGIDEKRLRLNWIQESDCASDFQPKYEFYYNTQLLPRRYSLGKDMWGYYNGNDGNTGLLESFTNPVPTVTITYTTPNSRAVNETKAQAGILTKIIYPTGGSSEFFYEAHKETDASADLGGLRIKTLVTNDAFGNVSTKNIKYLLGVLYINPVNYKNHFPNNNDNWTNAFLGGLDFGIAHASDPTPPMWSTQGYHIGYTKVKVEEPGNGYTLFRYLNTTPAFVNPAQYPFKPSVAGIGTSEQTNESYHKEGITDENIFVSASSMVKQNTGGSATINAKTVQTVSCLNCEYPAPNVFGIWMDYSIITYRFNMTDKTDVKDGVSTVTTYTYDPTHNSPKSSQFTDSRGIVHRTEFVYPGDAGSGAPTSMYLSTDPNFKNMLGTAIEQKSLVNGVLRSRTVNQFTQTGPQLLQTSTKNYPTGTTEFVEDQYRYDTNSNIISIIKSTGQNRSFLWGYKDQYPIASIDDPKYAASLNTKSATFGTSVTTNVGTCTTLAGSLVLNEAQTVSFSSSVQLSGATGLWIKLTMKNSGGTVVFGPRLYNAAGTFPEYVALPAGTYTFCYESGGYPTPYTGLSSINFIVNYADGIKNLYHTSFEELTTNVLLDARVGRKSWSGTVAFTKALTGFDPGEYVLSYFKKVGSVWTYQETPVTVTATGAYTISVPAASQIDELRFFPKGAQVKTYTYDPGAGMTSMTDSNNIVNYYEYDTSGRLKFIKDDVRDIVKMNAYFYKIK